MIRPHRRPPVGSSAVYLGGVVGSGRIRVLRNTAAVARRDNPWRVVSQALLVVPGVGLFVMALSVAFAVSLGGAGSIVTARSLLTMLLLVGLVACFAGTLSTTLQSLYLGRDVDFLLTLPVPLRTLFLTKVPDVAVGAIPGTLFLFAIATGQLLGRAAAVAYVPFAVATMAALLMIAVSLSSIVTALVVRMAPARLTRLALLLVSVTTVLAVGLLWQRLAVSAERSDAIGRTALLGGATSLLNYTPAGWASTVLAEATIEHYALAASWLGLLLGVALLCLAFASMVFATTFARTFELVAAAGGGPSAHRIPSWAQPLVGFVPVPIFPWVKREWTLLARDLRRLSAAAWPVSTLAAYLIATLLRDTHAGRPADERFWLTYGVLAALPWAISTGTVMFATGGEGGEIALIRALPVRAQTVIAGKLFAYLVPIVAASVLAEIILVAALEGISDDLLALVLLTVWVAVGATAIDLGGSTVAPNFEAEHIQRSTGMLGRMVSTLAGGVFLLLTVVGAAHVPGIDGAIGRALGLDVGSGGPAAAAMILTLAAVIPAFMLLVARDRYRTLLGDR